MTDDQQPDRSIEQLSPLPYKPMFWLDFDGVIHWYRHGYKGHGVIDDDPVPGVIEWILKMQEHWDVVIHSNRSSTIEGHLAMQAWLAKRGFPELKIYVEKPPASLGYDDRVITFKGYFEDPEELLKFVPWNRTAPVGRGFASPMPPPSITYKKERSPDG